MFKKSQIHKQLDMFSSQANLMCDREKGQYEAPNAWHNKFYRETTSKIDEDIFKPLYTEGNANKRDGRPNAPIRILVAMRILKEGCGCSDENLYEQCRYNLLFRAALGLFNLDDQCPSIDTYYGFYRALAKYNEEHQEDLLRSASSSLPAIRQRNIAYQARVSVWTASSSQAISPITPAMRSYTRHSSSLPPARSL